MFRMVRSFISLICKKNLPHIFLSQEERKKIGGTLFIEFQYCKMKPGTEIQDLAPEDGIDCWLDDSLYLYIGDIDVFMEEYADIFNCGIYYNDNNHNLERGLDLYGNTYYSPDQVGTITAEILESKATDYEILIDWLKKVKNYNGFYISGI